MRLAKQCGCPEGRRFRRYRRIPTRHAESQASGIRINVRREDVSNGKSYRDCIADVDSAIDAAEEVVG